MRGTHREHGAGWIMPDVFCGNEREHMPNWEDHDDSLDPLGWCAAMGIGRGPVAITSFKEAYLEGIGAMSGKRRQGDGTATVHRCTPELASGENPTSDRILSFDASLTPMVRASLLSMTSRQPPHGQRMIFGRHKEHSRTNMDSNVKDNDDGLL
ncbi:hypothetical protein BS17DRAFT_775415 [Gyrodon lividus]|nr:hypothetical protein BS17DRAFT_775415 [Gyrodon lividus]